MRLAVDFYPPHTLSTPQTRTQPQPAKSTDDGQSRLVAREVKGYDQRVEMMFMSL